MQGDVLPTLMSTGYFDALQVVANHLSQQTFTHGCTNMTVYPASFEVCGVFTDFSQHNILVVAPITFLSYNNTGVLKTLQSTPGGDEAPQSCKLFSACLIYTGSRLPVSDVVHCCAQVETPLTSKPGFPMVFDAPAQFPTPPSSPCFSMVLDILEQFTPSSARSSFYLVIDIGEITPPFSSTPFLFPIFSC